MLSQDKKLIRLFISLTIPALIEYVLQSAVIYADYIMVGRLGAGASAAIGLTEEVNFLLKGVMIAAGVGVVSYVSVSIGQGRLANVKKAAMQAFFLAAFC